MFCPSCNAPNREDAKFCKSCGHILRVEPAQAPEQVSTPAPAPAWPASPAPAFTEGTPPVATSAPAASEGQQPSTGSEDPALAPTLILSPEKVLAYRSRFWTQSEKETGQAAPAGGSSEEDISLQPTVII